MNDALAPKDLSSYSVVKEEPRFLQCSFLYLPTFAFPCSLLIHGKVDTVDCSGFSKNLRNISTYQLFGPEDEC
jgi:hypothetical protein